MVVDRLRRIVYFFAAMILDGLQLILTFANSLAQCDSYLPVSMVNVISLVPNALVTITAIVLIFNEILVFVVAEICRHGEPEAAHTAASGTIDSLPPDENQQAIPEIAALLQYIGTFLLERYLKERRVVDLAVTIDVLQVTKGLRTPSHPHCSSIPNTLAIAIFIRYRRSRKDSDLSKAIALHREALDLLRPDEPVHASSLKILRSAAIMWCRQHGGDESFLDVIDGHYKAVNTQTPEYPKRFPKEQSRPTNSPPSNGLHRPALQSVAFLHDAAVSCIKRYQREGGSALLTESIQLFQQALLLTPPGHPSRSVVLSSFASVITTRYERYGGDQDLPNAITLHREALSLQPPGHLNRSTSLSNLANAVTMRYQRDGRDQDLLEAITLNREALSLEPPSHPGRSTSLSNLACTVAMRYDRDGKERDLLEAITLHMKALSLRPPGHPDRLASLINLACALLTRHNCDGGERDLSGAITLYQEALSLQPLGHPARSDSLNNLAAAVRTRYNRDGRQRDLSEATTLHREALSLQPLGHPGRSASLNNLACAVITQYERDGGEQDLSEAITLHREALSLRPLGHPNRSSSLSNLAGTVMMRYERDGGERDLLEVITLQREALSLRPLGHPNRSSSLNHLANAVALRYRRDGGDQDLSEAITLCREALSLQPLGHPGRSASLNNLACAVITQYERDGGEQDLSEAITLHREALSLRPPSHPNRSNSLSNLAGAVIARYERDGGERDLSETITLHREALSLRPLGHPNRSASLNNLAIAVTAQYDRDGRERDLSEAITLYREVHSLEPPDHPARSASLTSLANTLFAQSRYFRGEKKLSLMGEIVQLLQDATAARTSPIPVRLQAALRWIEIAVEHNPESALEAYRHAFTHLGGALSLGRSLQSRHSSLLSESKRSRMAKELALDATLWVLHGPFKDPKLAIELLDQGRNMLLASVGQFRADLSDVRRQDAALADDFYRTSRVLDSAIMTGQAISEGMSPHEDPTGRYKRVSAEWETIVAKIRLLPDCEYFLLPMPYIKLQEAAVDGPVIVIVVGKERSTAIIVTLKGDPHTIDLPEASEEVLEEIHRDMDEVLGTPGRAVRGMRRVLSDLWKTLVQPIIQELQDILLIPSGSRIWWYPTSWASFLPLHAAGLYSKDGSNVPDLYISSYTPTLQALRRARGRPRSTSDQPTRPLIVSQAQTPGQAVLPSVDDEVGIVFSLVPDASLLLDDQGTKSNVLEKLRDHSWIHLACHGAPDLSDPFASHFALHDGPLTLQEIITNDLPSADLAYLAACHSAAQDRTLPDEGLALAGGMQFAGFKSVVGTLWAMADEDGPKLAKKFYKGLAMKSEEGKPLDCTKAAESLHDAVSELRKQKMPLSRWINFVHYGI